VIRHATASAFVFRRFTDGWRLGLIEHPLLERHTVVGGHVEDGESAEEAAVREALEESGYEVRILAPCGTAEYVVTSDNQLGRRHVHVDHQFVAIAESEPIGRPAHPFAWYAAHELESVTMFDDTRELAHSLLPRVSAISGVEGALSTVAPHQASSGRLRRKRAFDA
jgi:ADP-ribose pyrophosphatase YjhB (NUDIX family)